MMEFTVRIVFKFPPELLADEKKLAELYRQEGEYAAGLANAGLLKRAWRIPGCKEHLSLWEAPDATILHKAITQFPMWPYMDTVHVTPLAYNHNDPGSPDESFPDVQITYSTLFEMLNNGVSTLGDRVSFHQHPESRRPREIHFMVDGQKVAEFGPVSPAPPGVVEDVVPNYIDFLAEWGDRPVSHSRWVARIRRDNDLTVPYGSYEAALAAARHSHAVPGQ